MTKFESSYLKLFMTEKTSLYLPGRTASALAQVTTGRGTPDTRQSSRTDPPSIASASPGAVTHLDGTKNESGVH